MINGRKIFLRNNIDFQVQEGAFFICVSLLQVSLVISELESTANLNLL